MLTKIYNLVTGTVASNLAMSQQQPNWVRLGHREHRALCSRAVCSACTFPGFAGVAELLSTGDGAGLHFQPTCLGGADTRLLWREAGAGHIPLQPFVLPWAALPPHSSAGAGQRGAGRFCFCWVVAEEPACLPACLPSVPMLPSSSPQN